MIYRFSSNQYHLKAWFEANAAATMTTTGHANGLAVSATSSPESLGAFTITPVLGTISNTISLTDDDGNTFVYNTGDTETELPANATNLSATMTVKYHITYDGTLTDLQQVKDAWTSYWTTNGSAGLTLTIEDNSGAAYDALSEANKVGKTRVQTGEGVKLSKAAYSAVEDGYKGATSVSWTIEANTLKGLASSFTKPSDAIVCPSDQNVGTLYLALKGVDGLAQVATTYYSVDAHF